MNKVALAVILAVAGSASASQITFIHDGRSGSGSLDGVDFTDAAFSITSIGDTANVQSLGFGYYVDHSASTITISGLGDIHVLTGTRTFVSNSGNIVGYSRAGGSGLDLYNGPINAAFGTWDMQSSIGPISGDASLLQWNSGPINTDRGVLIFTSGGTAGTFTAIVPAPGTAALAVSALGFASRRRRNA